MSQSKEKTDPAPGTVWADSWRPEDKAQEAEEVKAKKEKEPETPPEPDRHDIFIGPKAV